MVSFSKVSFYDEFVMLVESDKYQVLQLDSI